MIGSHGFPRTSLADVQIFRANSPAAGTGWARWARRPGCTNVSIFAVAGGGGGGNGVIGAASTAAGGGGGGSSGQAYVECMAFMLPEALFVTVGFGGAANTAGISTRVSVFPDITANNCVATVSAGGAGGNASGATAGAAGTAGGLQLISGLPLAGAGYFDLFAGQAGIIGGTTVAGAALAYPTTGIRITGGTGGGGLPAGGVAGTNGGGITGTGVMDAIAGASGGGTATTPAANGSNGYAVIQPYGFWNGGTGGSSTHGTATGAGLVGGVGGAGGIGSGGGGGGGALTGSTAGSTAGGRGGDGLVIIVSW